MGIRLGLRRHIDGTGLLPVVRPEPELECPRPASIPQSSKSPAASRGQTPPRWCAIYAIAGTRKRGILSGYHM